MLPGYLNGLYDVVRLHNPRQLRNTPHPYKAKSKQVRLGELNYLIATPVQYSPKHV
jgi:hypothetical protein